VMARVAGSYSEAMRVENRRVPTCS
jgi:hypothetical protein